MNSLPKEVLAEKENIEKVITVLNDAMNRTEKSIIELAAIATFLHNIYNGIENILKQTLKKKTIDVPKSQTWHKDLLNISVSFRVISAELSDELYEYLTFRHFFIHAYGFMLKEEQLEGLARKIPDIWLRFLVEIKKFVNS